MWQTVAVMLILAAVVLYLGRHFAAVFRSGDTGCPGCSGSCCGQQVPFDLCNCRDKDAAGEEHSR
jgi:hypothetical protein